jgi:ribosomal protein L11 methyltransferase
MKWNKYKIETTTLATDILGGMLLEEGVDGVLVEDKIPLTEEEKKKLFIDFLPEMDEDEGIAYLSFYLEENDEEKEVLDKVYNIIEEVKSFMDAGSCKIIKSSEDDKDWINKWKEFFKPFTVEDILIKPTWEDISDEDKDKMIIEIDPGTAFGTGMHETTQLCISQMKKHLKEGMKVLDAGCGSGILSIAALKLNASYVTAIDIDEIAVTATVENLEINKLSSDKYKVIFGNILSDKNIEEEVGYEYDIVVANILADVIIPLSDIVPKHLKKGGIFITSGIINTKEEDVVNKIKSNTNFEILEVQSQNDWRSVVAIRV